MLEKYSLYRKSPFNHLEEIISDHKVLEIIVKAYREKLAPTSNQKIYHVAKDNPSYI